MKQILKKISIIQEFIKSELKSYNLELTTKTDVREGVDFFIDNNVKLMPSLSNWEIKVSSNTIPQLNKYSFI